MTEPDPAGQTLNVYWWAQSQHGQPPRTRHVYGWSELDTGRHGTVTVTSQRPWLDRAAIETALTAELTSTLTGPITLTAAADHPHQLDPVTALQVAGYTVHHLDLTTAYGLDTVAAVTAQLRGRGTWALVALEQTLSDPVRAAAAHWAAAAIHHFTTATTTDLTTTGWTQTTHDRWQLLATQPP